MCNADGHFFNLNLHDFADQKCEQPKSSPHKNVQFMHTTKRPQLLHNFLTTQPDLFELKLGELPGLIPTGKVTLVCRETKDIVEYPLYAEGDVFVCSFRLEPLKLGPGTFCT